MKTRTQIFVLMAITTALFSTGCSSRRVSQVPTDMRLELLTAEEMKKDLKHLSYTLQTAYAGSRFLDKSLIDQTVSELYALTSSASDNTTTEEFCLSIQKILSNLPDPQITPATLDERGRMQTCKVLPPPAWNVGRNLNYGATEAWELKTLRTPKRNRVHVVAVSNFQRSAGAAWEGFPGMAGELRHVPFFIVDLRGNPGGDDVALQNWVRSLYQGKRKFQLPVYTLQNPNAIRIRINAWEMLKNSIEKTIAANVSKGIGSTGRDPDILDFLNKRIDEEYVKLSLAERSSGWPAWEEKSGEPVEGLAPISFDGKVYVLIDNDTGSVAEEGVRWLQNLFKVITVGQTTRGTLRFANLGIDILPSSGIAVPLAVSYFDTKKGKTGTGAIDPDIRVGTGGDALEAAMAHIDRTFRADSVRKPPAPTPSLENNQ